MQHVLLELRAILGEVVRGTSPGGKEHVEKVRRAPHHPTTGPGPVGHHGAASLQVGNTLGHQKRQAHWLAGGGRGGRHLLPQRWVMLHIVEGRHGADPIAQGRMGGHYDVWSQASTGRDAMSVGIIVPLPAYTLNPAFIAPKAEALGFESIWYHEHPILPVDSASPFPATGG